MFNNLYEYIPDNWKFYISKDKLNKVINHLNRFNYENIFPKKEYIFNGFSINPNDIRIVLFGDIYNNDYNIGIPYGIDSSKNITNILQNIFNEIYYEYNIFPKDKSLKYLISQGILFLNFPLTCLSKQKYIHYDLWKEIITEIIFKLIYNVNLNNHILLLICFNELSIKFLNEIITDWIPNENIDFYYTPSHKNVFLMIFNNPNKNINDIYLPSFYKSNCFKKINLLLKKHNEKLINWG